jgi:primosomal protein N' (replication factor Y)
LKERESACLPPYNFFALIRVEAYDARHATTFLQKIKTITGKLTEGIRVLGPVFAPMPRRAGRHRMQLLIQSIQRPVLQHFLKALLPEIEKIPDKQQVRWALDVDPLEMF